MSRYFHTHIIKYFLFLPKLLFMIFCDYQLKRERLSLDLKVLVEPSYFCTFLFFCTLCKKPTPNANYFKKLPHIKAYEWYIK